MFSAAVIIAQGLLSASPSLAGQAKVSWEVEWEKTVAAARREGEVHFYSNNTGRRLVETGAFQKAHPGIKVVSVAPGGSAAFQRLMEERRAGQYLADLYNAGTTSVLALLQANALDPIKPLLVLPEVLDESKWWGGKHRYNDHEQKYVFIYTGTPLFGRVFYNTKLVNPKEIGSLWDLVHPKWKGKIAARDIRIPGTGSVNMLFFFHHPQIGPKFIGRLFGEMDITVFRDTRQGVDWLGTGRSAICFFCYPNDIEAAQKQGLPVAEFGMMKEGAAMISQGGAVALVKNAPHPNAAKVFVNWLLSREGQLVTQRVTGNSRRVDIPKDMLPPNERLVDGVKYLDVETPELNDLEPVFKVVEKALAEAEKRKRGQ
jgi:iron(III) transport system substrate-binding protein